MIDRLLDAVSAILDAAIAPVALIGCLFAVPVLANTIAAFAL